MVFENKNAFSATFYTELNTKLKHFLQFDSSFETDFAESRGKHSEISQVTWAYRNCYEVCHCTIHLLWAPSYEYIQQNMQEALPYQTIIHREYKIFDEGVFQFDELRNIT